MTSKQTSLFGGAVTCSIPSGWRDVSTVRQVPDNQEVYQDCTEKTGCVLVVEILQHQSDVKNEAAAEFFFKDLAESNGCTDGDCSLESSKEFTDVKGATNDEGNCDEYIVQNILENIKQSPSDKCHNCCIIAMGRQNLVQGKTYTGTGAAAEKTIYVEMCILRLEHVDADLLITLSTPMESINKSNEHQSTFVTGVFKNILSRFRIEDWLLFG